MPYNPNRHHRRSIRLEEYDYRQAGLYFVTICTQDRLCLFGEVVDGEMVLNEAGRMIRRIWDELPQHYPGVETDAVQIMPNHVHGIIILTTAPVGRAPVPAPNPLPWPKRGNHRGLPLQPPP